MTVGLPTARRVDGRLGATPVCGGTEHVDRLGVEDVPLGADHPNPHPLPRDGATHEHDPALVPAEHRAPRHRPLDVDLDQALARLRSRHVLTRTPREAGEPTDRAAGPWRR